MADYDGRAQLQSYIQVLVGLPLSIARNAADMKIFHFGDVRPSGKGTAGSFGLHIQCPWRLVAGGAVFTGASDRFFGPAEGAEVDDDDPRSGNLQLIRIASLLKGYDEATKSFVNTTEQLVVISADIDDVGGADLLLSGGYRLQIFSDSSVEEDWRFVELKGRHIVIEGGRVRVD